jgi:shikimate dehydrogenase
MELYGILGHPAGHSLSPFIHNWGFAAKGLDKSYHRFDIAPEKLSTFMTCVRTLPIHGLSVTIPHKEAMLSFMDELTPAALKIGAVNTVVRTQSGRLLGDNTDVTGFLAPLREQSLCPATALVLGGGGAARAVLHGLRQLGSTTFVSCRNQEAGTALARVMGATFVNWESRSTVRAELLINTTPLGMQGHLEDASPWPFSLADCRACYDLVYTPHVTRFLAQGRAQGVRVISGLDMFVHQAAAQFRRWTGQPLPLPEATVRVASRLSSRAKRSR